MTVVEAFATPASRVLPPAIGMALAGAAVDAGVDLRTDTSVEALLGPGVEGAAGGDGDLRLKKERIKRRRNKSNLD